jgi:tellurite resistance protein TehA-like permease
MGVDGAAGRVGRGWHGVWTAARAGVRELYPGYFAMVMATGILSVGTRRLGLPTLSSVLLWIAAAAYVALLLLSVARIWSFRDRLAEDLANPQRMFTFFTFVAGSAVLGVRLLAAGRVGPALVLALLAGLAWVVLSYVTFGTLFLTGTKPALEAVNGGWLIAVVGTQSVAILAANLADRLRPDTVLLLAAYALWGTGVLLYVVLISLIVLRLAFHRLRPADLSPPYWINMGATAISVVAAGALLGRAPNRPFLAEAAPFLYGTMILLWSWGTWWIPLLVLMGIWKYGVRGLPLAYEPALWSLVFPLGMYTVATLEVAQATGVAGLTRFAGGFVWVGLGAWLLVFCGWARSLGRAALADLMPRSAAGHGLPPRALGD